MMYQSRSAYAVLTTVLLLALASSSALIGAVPPVEGDSGGGAGVVARGPETSSSALVTQSRAGTRVSVNQLHPASVSSGFPTIHDTTIVYVELANRSGYSVYVPSTTTSGWWRDAFLFLDLDSYSIRVERYRHAFVAAMMQPELAARLKVSGSRYAQLRDVASESSKVVEAGSDLADLLAVLKSGGTWGFQPAEIQTTLLNWQRVVNDKHFVKSLGKLSVALSGVSLALNIRADVAQDMFLHSIENAALYERMECLQAFLDHTHPSDPAISAGFNLAKADVAEFIEKDVNVIQSTLNAFQSHGAGYLVEFGVFTSQVATEFGLIKGTLATSVTRLVIPYYLSYQIITECLADVSDMQSMCCAATINELLFWYEIDLETQLPGSSDPAYESIRRLILNTVQIRYGLGYWYNAKYDKILELNWWSWLNPADWIKFLVQMITGSYGSAKDFRSDVLSHWMDENYNHTVEINPYLEYPAQAIPAVVSHRQGTSRDTNIWVTFNKAMDKSTCTNSTIVVVGSMSGTKSCTFPHLDPSTHELTIDPQVDFVFGETVSVTVGTGVKDLAGISMASSYAFSFPIETAPPPDPTDLTLTATLNPSSNLVPGAAVLVTGSAYYNTGSAVPVGTATINTGDNLYTAPVSGGAFSAEIAAPSTSRNISITLLDNRYGLTKAIQKWLTIKGDEGGSGYTLERTTTCRDVQGSSPYNPIYETEFFRRSDTQSMVWVRLTDVTRSLQVKWEFYEPDGTLHLTNTYTVPDPHGSGWDYWESYHCWWSVYIRDYLASYRPGRWTCKLYIHDGSGWKYRTTEQFTIGWEFTEHRMTRNVNTSTPPYNTDGETDVFEQTDARAWTWANADRVVESFDVRWIWYEPNGSQYTTYDFAAADPGQNSYYDYYRFWGWIGISGNSAASKCGNWHVDVFVKDASATYQKTYTDYFQIIENPNVAPSVAVTTAPAAPIESQSVTLNVSASDNTYLQKVVVYWNDGSLHSDVMQDNIFSSSYASSKSVGSFASGQRLEYWAEAWDTSGNREEGEHRTLIVLAESVSVPGIPSGNAYRKPGESANYTATSSTSSLGHTVEYQFDWGDGSTPTWGAATQSHSWTSQGYYYVRARARCQLHPERLSDWSSSLAVAVDSTGPVVDIQANNGLDFTTDQVSVALDGVCSDPEPMSGLSSVTISTGQTNEGMARQWRFTVSLTPGPNILTVTAVDLAGNSGTDTITVTLVRGPGVGIRASDLRSQLVPRNPVRTWGRVTSSSPLRISDGRAEIEVTGLSALDVGDFVWVEGDWNGSVLAASQQPQKAKAYKFPSKTEMLYVPAGSFLMGNSGVGDDLYWAQAGSCGPEEPQHWVSLPGYWMGKFEVTREQYQRFIDAGGYSNDAYWSQKGRERRDLLGLAMPLNWNPPWDWGTGPFTQTPDHPAVGLSFYEAEAFCNWAGLRLPTEAEWEKAARWSGGHPNVYPWGDTWNREYCNNFFDHDAAGGGYQVNETAQVGSYPSGASPYGCEDMAGNAEEWVYDWRKSYPGSAAPFDDSDVYRVLRGGSWSPWTETYTWRCAVRDYDVPDKQHLRYGFRVAR